MTYNVLSGTLNSTIPYLPHFVLMLLERLWVWQLVMCCCVTTSYTLFTPCACPQATEFHYLCNNLEGLKLAARWWPQKGEENQYPNDTELPYSDLGLTVFLHTQQLFNCSLSGGGLAPEHSETWTQCMALVVLNLILTSTASLPFQASQSTYDAMDNWWETAERNVEKLRRRTLTWLRGIVWYNVGLWPAKLSLSCTRHAADGWPLMWVNHPL